MLGRRSGGTVRPTIEPMDLGHEPPTVVPAIVSVESDGPGRLVGFEEAVQLAERAMSRPGQEAMLVVSAERLDLGWAFWLQGERYIRTRAFSDQLVGHGITIVEERTGAVFGSGSGAGAWAAIAAVRARIKDRKQ